MRNDGGCGHTSRACSVSFIIGLLFAKCLVLQTEVFDDNICHRPGRSAGQGARGGVRSCSVSVCVLFFLCLFINVFLGPWL